MYHVVGGGMDDVSVFCYCLSELFQFSTVNVNCFCNKNTREAFFFLKVERQNWKTCEGGKKKCRERTVGTSDQSHKDLRGQKQDSLILQRN